MEDHGVTQKRSILNYFQKEKSNVPLTKDKKINDNPIMVELKKDSLDSGDVNHPISKSKNDLKVKESIPSIDSKELDHCDLDQGDCQKINQSNVRDGSEIEQECHIKDNVKEKCHSERKGKWNFSWKQGKTRKSKRTATMDTSDRDQDFEMNLESNIAKSNEREIIITKSKTPGKKGSRNRAKTSRHNSKPVIEIWNVSNSEERLESLSDISQDTNTAEDKSTKRYNHEISSPPERNDHDIKSEANPFSINSVTEISLNETNDKGFESESNKINLDRSDEIKTVEIVKIKNSCESPEFTKDGLENSKKNFFDILMQSSKQKTLQKQKSDVAEGESDNHKEDLDSSSSCKEDNRMDESIKKDEKKGKRNKASRRKKDSGVEEDVGIKVQPEKQTRSHSKKYRQDKCNANELAVRRSARAQKSSICLPEDIENLNQGDAMDIPVVNEVSTKPKLTTKRTLKTATKEIALEATVVVSLDNKDQLEERKQDLPEEQVRKPVLQQTGGQGDIESGVRGITDTCGKATHRKNCDDSKSTQPGRERRLRKSCILDSSDEEEQATELRVETKASPVKRNDNQPQKVSGPIAPIFLPGAWRRAKAKLEEAKILEAGEEIVEINEYSSPRPVSKAANSPVHCDSDVPNVNPNVAGNSSASLSAFLGIFKRPTTKPCSVPIQFAEAPFPKVSHVQQKDEVKHVKWNLPMVRNQFVKDEYFFCPDENGSVMEHSMSLSFLKTDISCLKKKTTLISKSNQLNVLLELDKNQKQEILSYLKTIYEGIPIRKLFKRCHHQLHICKKLLMENKNVAGRSIKMEENLKRALTSGVKGPLVSSNVSVRSTHAPVKPASFTKISKKMRTTAQSKTKIERVKKKENPLLLAFQNQENAAKNKNVELVKTRSMKEKGKASSIVDFVEKQTKQVEDIPTKKQSGKLKKGKKSSGVNNKIDNYVDKKRLREGEDQDDKPSGKKAKLINDGQEFFKKPRNGQKRKARSVDSKENGNTVILKEDNSDQSGKSPKCRKISSDEDFIKPSTRHPRLKVDTNNDAAEDCGTGKQPLRKSQRLQEKSVAEMKDVLADAKIAPVETNDEGVETDIIELLEVKKDCPKQDDQARAHESDTKAVEDEASELVEETTKQISKPNSCVEKSINEESGVSFSAVLWSECFKPRNSTEILGNTNAGGKLRNWLFEWKTLREKKLEALKRHEEKKYRRLTAKKSKKENSSWWQDDDDSDFYSSDNSDDENFGDEDILCNTMLLSGPVGSGKTSAIYACAEELGFKVIEVNSSTKRGGKYILSELLEATQSHQVSTKRSTQTELFSRANAAASEDKEKPQKEQTKRNKKKKGLPKKKEQLSEETQLQGPMSLILLDEVDVLFEEDKGFWVSVNTLRQNSKRPIVMTSSDLTAIDIDGEYEHIMLKSPSVKLYAAHFQTICLTKDVFVNPSDIRALSWLYHADIRRLLLNLQFWVDSAAGACDKRGITIRNDIGTGAGILRKNDVESGLADTNQCGNTEDISAERCKFLNAVEVGSTVRTQKEFYVKARSVSVNVDDSTAFSTSPNGVESRLDKKDSNNEMLTLDKGKKLESSPENKVDITKEFDLVDDKQDCGQGENDVPPSLGKNDAASSQKAQIEMHNLCLESMLGIRNIDNKVGNVLETLKCHLNTKDTFRRKCLVTSHCQGLNMDIVYCNAETILPCVFLSGNKGDEKPLNQKPRNDYGHSFGTETDANSLKDQNDFKSFVNIQDGTKDDATVSDEDLLSKKFDGISLTCLGNFYEDMSFMDSELCRDDPGASEEIFDSWSARISPGLNDAAGKHNANQIPWKTTNLQNELRGALEVASLEHACRKFHNLCSHSDEQLMKYANKLMSKSCAAPSCSDQDDMSDMKVTDSRISWKCRDEMAAASTNALNALDGDSCLQVTTLSENLASKTREREQEFSSISSHLPELNCLNRRIIVMDYRPTFHTICKDESLRKASRVKRRFYHYFDSIGLPISSSVIQTLTENSYFS